MLRIDAHHHLWNYNSVEYDWLNGDLAVLQRNFEPSELIRELRNSGVSGSVVVQARQSIAETDWLLQLASNTPTILGVVGWLPISDSHFGEVLDRYSTYRAFKGIRHVLQTEPTGFMDDAAFNEGLRSLRSHDLVYDVLIFERQLQEATRLVDRHPSQIFVLDHIGKPRIAAAEFEPWSARIRELARRENVVCKVSGMVTEADQDQWSPEQLRPYFETVLACFTPARLMAGSDWPVLRARCTYKRWWEILADWVSELSPQEQAKILGETAVSTYHLSPPRAAAPNVSEEISR